MDTQVMQEHLIYIFSHDEGNGDIEINYETMLPYGETMLERQLRLFCAKGVRSFVLAMDKPSAQLPENLRPLLPADCRVDTISKNEMARSICSAYDNPNFSGDIIALADNTLFDSKYAGMLLNTPGSFVGVSIHKTRLEPRARLGLKYVEKIGKLTGINCYPLLHTFKLGPEKAAELRNEGDFEKALIQRVSELNLEAMFDGKAFVFNLHSESDVEHLSGVVLNRDRAVYKTYRSPGCLSKLPETLSTLSAKKPLVVCEESVVTDLVKDILDRYGITYCVIVPEGIPNSPESIDGVAAAIDSSECDSVLAVGKKAILLCAKTARLCALFGVPASGLEGELRIRRRLPLIVVPQDKAGEKKHTSSTYRLPLGYRAISHPFITPEYVFIDHASRKYGKIAPATRTIPAAKLPKKDVPPKGLKGKILWHLRKLMPDFPNRKQNRYTRKMRRKFETSKKHCEINNQTVLFQSFHGKQASCNPRGIYEAMQKSDAYIGFNYIWAVKDPKKYASLAKRPHTKVVKIGSSSYLNAVAKSRFIVSNVALQEYIDKLSPEQVFIHTWHGKPVKKIGADMMGTTGRGQDAELNKRVFSKYSKQLTYLLSPSKAFTPYFESAFNLKELNMTNKIRETGYPRNDFLFQYTDTDVVRLRIKFGIPLNKKVILYAPTWRATSYESGTGYVYGNTIDFNKLYEELGDEYVLLFRAHNYEANSVDSASLGHFVKDVTQENSVNDLMIISDVLISDYSGIIFDYAILKKPMVLYQYDREEYVNTLPGVYFDLDEIPGTVVKKEEELAGAIRGCFKDFTYDEKYRRFNERYNGLDGADCGLKTALALIPPDTLKTPAQLKKEEKLNRKENLDCRFHGFLRKTGLKRTQNDEKLLSFKDKYKGKRCFLVGNGPSLRREDLEAIRDEISFCCNGIYRIFNLTYWRPTFYFISDNVFSGKLPQIRKYFKGTFFSNNHFKPARTAAAKYNIVYANTLTLEDYYVHGNMLDYYVSSRATVMSFMIEMAMYMGFREIYLLGVDCSNGFTGQNDHFINNYESKEMVRIEVSRTKNLARDGKQLSMLELGQYRVDRSMAAYYKLREYADKHGIKVYNATRGGMLEAFERVDFDELHLKKRPRTQKKKRGASAKKA